MQMIKRQEININDEDVDVDNNGKVVDQAKLTKLMLTKLMLTTMERWLTKWLLVTG